MPNQPDPLSDALRSLPDGWTGTAAQIWETVGGVEGVSRDKFLQVIRARGDHREPGVRVTRTRSQGKPYVYTIQHVSRLERLGDLDVGPTEDLTSESTKGEIWKALDNGAGSYRIWCEPEDLLDEHPSFDFSHEPPQAMWMNTIEVDLPILEDDPRGDVPRRRWRKRHWVEVSRKILEEVTDYKSAPRSASARLMDDD